MDGLDPIAKYPAQACLKAFFMGATTAATRPCRASRLPLSTNMSKPARASPQRRHRTTPMLSNHPVDLPRPSERVSQDIPIAHTWAVPTQSSLLGPSAGLEASLIMIASCAICFAQLRSTSFGIRPLVPFRCPPVDTLSSLYHSGGSSALLMR